MNKFNGTIDELKTSIEEYGMKGSWSETPNAYKFNTDNGGVLLWYQNTRTLQVQGKPQSRPHITDLINYLVGSDKGSAMQTATPTITPVSKKEAPTVFIVYGHDEESRDQLEFILTKLEIKHVILAKESGKGNTIIEALEEHIGPNGSASIGIVLLTPDDMGFAVKDGQDKIRGRARQNVILEFGMIIAKLGRQNTIMILKGDVERPSDTDGIIYLQYNKNVREVVNKLVTRLSEGGCHIDHKTALAISK